MKQLTYKQNEILNYIKDFIFLHGFSPSIRDIAKEYNMSPNGAYDHVKALENKGKIVRNADGAARSITIADGLGYKPDIETLQNNKKYFIIRDKMARLPKGEKCVICDTRENVERHHEDYNKVSETIDLCSKHHRELHIVKKVLLKKGYCLIISPLKY